MKFNPVKILFILLPLFLYVPSLHAAEDIDWITGQEPLHEAGAGSPVIGTRWGIAARKDNIQISFRLEASSDMTRGGWIGDIRAPEKFYVKFYLVDDVGVKRFFKVENARAVGADAEYGIWKKGPPTAAEQMMMYDFSWDDIQKVKKAKAFVIGFTPYENADDSKDITIPLDNFATRIDQLEVSVKKVDGGARFVMTREEIDTTPMIELPVSITQHWQADLKKVSEELSIPVSELHKLSMREIAKRHQDKIKADKEAKYAKTKKAHQAIYDQEPEWFDINVCPKPDVSYCKNIGKKAYREDSMIDGDGEKFSGAMTIKYGKIYGVIWRSKDSIIEVYPGDIKFNRDPRIYRAPKAEYYYIIKNGDHIKIKSAAVVYAKY